MSKEKALNTCIGGRNNKKFVHNFDGKHFAYLDGSDAECGGGQKRGKMKLRVPPIKSVFFSLSILGMTMTDAYAAASTCDAVSVIWSLIAALKRPVLGREPAFKRLMGPWEHMISILDHTSTYRGMFPDPRRCCRQSQRLRARHTRFLFMQRTYPTQRRLLPQHSVEPQF